MEHVKGMASKIDGLCSQLQSSNTTIKGLATCLSTIVTIQVHLAGTELTDLKELAQMADRLWSRHAPQMVATIQV